MNINQYLDSTYLKTPEQAGISNSDTLDMVHKLTQEAIDNDIYAVMIRPDYVRSVRELLDEKKSNVVLGTVIGFPEGTYDLNEKLREAQKAIADGADELDFVVNYEAFKKGTEAIMELVNDKCDVVVIDSATAQKYVADNDGLKIVEDNDAFDSEEYAIAVQKGNTELLDKINTAIEKLISDGKVSEYAAKYTDEDAE